MIMIQMKLIFNHSLQNNSKSELKENKSKKHNNNKRINHKGKTITIPVIITTTKIWMILRKKKMMMIKI